MKNHGERKTAAQSERKRWKGRGKREEVARRTDDWINLSRESAARESLFPWTPMNLVSKRLLALLMLPTGGDSNHDRDAIRSH